MANESRPSVVVVLESDDRDFLAEALGAYAMQYKSGAESARCERIAKRIAQASAVGPTSALLPEERASIRESLSAHEVDAHDWFETTITSDDDVPTERNPIERTPLFI